MKEITQMIAEAYKWVWTSAPSLAVSNCRTCLLYTSDAADERSSVDLGGRRIIKKKKSKKNICESNTKESEARKKHKNELTYWEHATAM